MEHDGICVCGHPQALHRTYGCTGWRPNPDPKKTDRVWCQCKTFRPKKSLMSTTAELKFSKSA